MIIITENSKIMDIQTKIDKVMADMEKRMDRLHKLEAKEEVLVNKIKALGVDVPQYEKFQRSKYAKSPNTMGHWRYDELSNPLSNHLFQYFDRDLIQNNFTIWEAVYDLINNLRDQASSWNKYFELEDKLTTLKTKLQQEQVRQKEVDEIPPILRQLKEEIFKNVLAGLVELREKVYEFASELRQVPMREYKKRQEMERQFAQRYGSGTFDRLIEATDEQLEKEANKTAESYVLNLIARVTKKIGTITDYSDVRIDGPSINGRIIGERGSTYVETILAGGYNIQCLHYRVILH